MGSLVPRPLDERNDRKQERRLGYEVVGSPRPLKTRKLSCATAMARAWLRSKLVSSYPEESECPSTTIELSSPLKVSEHAMAASRGVKARKKSTPAGGIFVSHNAKARRPCGKTTSKPGGSRGSS